jgi:hypothetical protein
MVKLLQKETGNRGAVNDAEERLGIEMEKKR